MDQGGVKIRQPWVCPWEAEDGYSREVAANVELGRSEKIGVAGSSARLQKRTAQEKPSIVLDLEHARFELHAIVMARADPQGGNEDGPSIGGINDAVDPETGGGVTNVRLFVVGRLNFLA